MKSEIIDKNQLTSIQMAAVWTLPEGGVFPDFSDPAHILEEYSQPTYVFIESGKRSGELDFLKYATRHDPGTSWNPATMYGPGILEAFKHDSEAYQDLEGILLPELITSEDWSSNIRFFGTVPFLGTSVSLLRLPPDTWLVEFYSVSGVMKNYGKKFIPSEYPLELEVYPTLRVMYGPDSELQNNPVEMYQRLPDPDPRTKSVSSGEYKIMIDELRAPKILAIKFTSAGLENVETFNISTGAWYAQRGQEEVPERHKSMYYLGKPEFKDSKDIDVVTEEGEVLIDPLSGILIGTEKLKDSPVRDMIFSESTKFSFLDGNTYNNHVRYPKESKVMYGKKTYISLVNNNIGADPILTGAWELDSKTVGRFNPLPQTMNSVDIRVLGGGDIVFPEPTKDGEYISMVGRVGTTKGYLRLRIKPDPGYTLKSHGVYSYYTRATEEILIGDSDGTHVLKIGADSNTEKNYGYSFCFEFEKFRISVVTDFYVPGINYYTYVQETDKYTDYNTMYNSLTARLGYDNDTVKVLPMCSGMIVSYTTPKGEALGGAEFGDIEGINLTLPPESMIVEEKGSIRLSYHGLLEYYEIPEWTIGSSGESSITAVYHSNGQTRRAALSRRELDNAPGGIFGREGDTLWVQPVLQEAITHLEIKLRPRKITMVINTTPGSDAEPSIEGAYINVGEILKFKVYKSSGERPVVESTGTTTEIEEISTRTWSISIYGITEAGTILIS